jgi:hypothetical protein
MLIVLMLLLPILSAAVHVQAGQSWLQWPGHLPPHGTFVSHRRHQLCSGCAAGRRLSRLHAKVRGLRV